LTKNRTLLGIPVELQKITTLELHNVAFSTVGLEMNIDLAKGFNNTVSDFTKTQSVAE